MHRYSTEWNATAFKETIKTYWNQLGKCYMLLNTESSGNRLSCLLETKTC